MDKVKGMFLVGIVSILLLLVSEPKLYAGSWWDKNYKYRIGVEIKNGPERAVDYPVEVKINFSKYLSSIREKTGLNSNSIRVVEYDKEIGEIIEEVPSQFSKHKRYNEKTFAVGNLSWLMKGKTDRGEKRYYYIYFSPSDSKVTQKKYKTDLVYDYQKNDFITLENNYLKFKIDEIHRNRWQVFYKPASPEINFGNFIYAWVYGYRSPPLEGTKNPVHKTDDKEWERYVNRNIVSMNDAEGWEVLEKGPIFIKIGSRIKVPNNTRTKETIFSYQFTIYSSSKFVKVKWDGVSNEQRATIGFSPSYDLGLRTAAEVWAGYYGKLEKGGLYLRSKRQDLKVVVGRMRDLKPGKKMSFTTSCIRVVPYDELPAEEEDIFLYASSVEEITALSKMLSIKPIIKAGKIEKEK